MEQRREQLIRTELLFGEAAMERLWNSRIAVFGIGGFSGQPYKVITTIARQHDSAKIFRIVRDIDPQAFVSQSQVRGVFGEGFDRLKDSR